MPALIALILMLRSGGTAFAHGSNDESLRAQWTFDPWLAVPLLLLGAIYAVGAIRLYRRARNGRSAVLLRASAYASGWLMLTGALLSPLHWLGERMFTFHMIEHEIMMACAAPMMVAAKPFGAMLWGLPRSLRLGIGGALGSIRFAWRWASGGAQATLIHALAIWAWHVPFAFDAAVTNIVLHRLQHLSFFLTAVLFWWSVFWRSDRGVAAWHVFVTMIHTGVLGALMALAPRVLYIAQTRTAAEWGMTPLEDQQLAGLVMWIPAGTIYAGAALAMAALWIRQSGQLTKRARYAGS